ncbi:MAG: alpha/beta fold hydrolase [Chloroflexi bacterium]|nr:MAG: alpha/beta fold hydrolase [Chloroflexota bacterium]
MRASRGSRWAARSRCGWASTIPSVSSGSSWWRPPAGSAARRRAGTGSAGRWSSTRTPGCGRDTAEVYAQAPNELEEGLLIRRQSTADPRGYGNACAAMAALFEAPLDPELGQIKAPALIVASDLDQHCPPKAAEIIQSGIPGSRIEILKGAGHAIPVERPRELAAAINKFFS